VRFKKEFRLVVFVTIALSLAGCLHIGGAKGQPARKATPLENALFYNAALSQANLDVAQGVISASESTPPGIDVSTANRILTAQSKIADADRQLTFILQSGAVGIQSNGQRIRQLLDQIKESAKPLIGSGDLGIKNAGTQKKLIDSITTIYTLADQVLDVLIGGGLLK
jgi:hypothetical protein